MAPPRRLLVLLTVLSAACPAAAAFLPPSALRSGRGRGIRLGRADPGATALRLAAETEPGPSEASPSVETDDALPSAAAAASADATAPIVGGEGVNGLKASSTPLSPAVEQESSARPTPEPSNDTDDDGRSVSELLTYLQTLGAITGRGEFATRAQRASATQVLAQLEARNPTIAAPGRSAHAWGRWELLFSTTELFRGSPFFLAGRATCRTPEEARRYDWFCTMHRRALAVSTIGAVRQVVAPDRLVSEFEVRAGAVPFLRDLTPLAYSGGLPLTVDGAIVSTAHLEPVDDGWRLDMDSVEIKGSNVPGVRQLLDGGVRLSTRTLGDLLERSLDGYRNPRPCLRTTFLSEQFRVSRDQDGNAFVYVKTSNDTAPTDYSGVDADLGVARLLEGFNDAFTRIYL